jgi:adenosine deaminase
VHLIIRFDSRIDHGVRCIKDPKLVARLKEDQVPLTSCAFRSVTLRVFNSIRRAELSPIEHKNELPLDNSMVDFPDR